MTSYSELADWLESNRIGSYMQNEDRMVIANKNPATPDGNCLWVTLKNGVWYVGTFLPAVYRVPEEQSIGAVCKDIFDSSVAALYRIHESIVKRYNLDELKSDEIDRF